MILYFTSLNIPESTKFFAETEGNAKLQQCKLDDRLQPIPEEIHASIVRTKESTLLEYEKVGEFIT